MGMVYRQKGRRNWLIKYYRDGRPIVESSGTDIKDDAKTILKKREAAIADGVPVSNRTGKLRFEEAALDVVNDYKVNNRHSLDELQRRIDKHLTPYFGGRRMAAITTADVRAYIAKRQDAVIIVRKAREDGEAPLTKPVSNAEINRELTALKRMFTLALQAGKLLHRPHIPMLQEQNVRTGFFERDQFGDVLRHLPSELHPLLRFAYITGWRIPSEVQPLQWRNVDFKAGEVRLDHGTTKNRDGRVFKMTTELRAVLEQQRDEHERLKREGLICPYVFMRLVAEGRGGKKRPKPIRAFKKAWDAACRAAGCPGRIPHDLRRTAVRNMVRAGIPERVAMKLTGHKTRSVFERYNIVSDGDLATAAEKLNGLPALGAAKLR
jgi:integrase